MLTSIGQQLSQHVVVRVALDVVFDHGVPDDLRRALAVAQHDGLVEVDALGLVRGRPDRHPDDIEVGRNVRRAGVRLLLRRGVGRLARALLRWVGGR